MQIAGVNPNTLKKAKHLLDGKPIEELVGKPPPQSAESKEGRMASAIAEKLGVVILDSMRQKADDNSPGVLQKPAVNPKK
jgi:hypothetical protein